MRILWLLIVAVAFSGGPRACAQVSNLLEDVRQNPFVLLADRILTSARQQVIELSGRVRLATTQAGLRADRVRLNSEQVILEGQVKITTPNNGLIADRLILDRQSQTVQLQRVFFSAAQRYISARLVTVEEGGQIMLLDGLLSNCAGCYTNRPAPWQIYLGKATYSPEDEQIRLRNIQLVLFGQPVLRVPFWQLVNPSLRRLSGYLPFRITSSEAGGTSLKIGKFWALNEQEDVTAWLTLGVDGTLLSDTRYRWANDRAWFEARARAAALLPNSQTQAYFGDQENWVGDVELHGDWFINDRFRLKGGSRLSQHDNFGQGFGHDTADYSKTSLTLEYFHRGAYANLTLAQDQLQTTDPAATYRQAELPLRLTATYQDRQRLIDTLEGFWGLDLIAAERLEGRDSARLSAYAGFAPSPLPFGPGTLRTQTYALGGIAKAQGLDLASDAINPALPAYTGSSSFALLGSSADWHASLLSSTFPGLILSPRVRLSHLSGRAPDTRVANEDSRLPFLSYATLWRLPYQGPYDRLQTGSWIDTGLSIDAFSLQDQAKWHIQGYGGIRHNPEDEDLWLMSAQVEQLETALSLAYEGRWSANTGQTLSHDFSVQTPLGAAPNSWLAVLSYGYEAGILGLTSGQQGALSLTGAFNDAWSGSFNFSEDLKARNSAKIEAKLRYADCCLGLNIYAAYDENDGDPETTLGFEVDLIGLTTLGSQSLLSF